MKTIHIVLIILFIGVTILQSQDDVKYITGKITLADGGNVKKEVYVYFNRFRNNDDNLLKVVETDANGEFKVPIPKTINYAELHLAAPGYEAFMTDYIEGDKSPRVEATLFKRTIPQELDSAGIYFLFSNDNYFMNYPITNKEYLEFTVDLEDSTFSKYKMEGNDKLSYAYIMGESTITPEENSTQWKYDNNGDYNAVVTSINSKLKFKINFNDYKRFAKDLPTTNGKWVDSPVNEKYNEAVSLLPHRSIARARQDYYYFVKQANPDVLKSLSDEEIEKRKQSTLETFNSYITTNDSLLVNESSPYLKDYLTLIKLELLMGTDSLTSWEEKYKILESLNEIPTVFYSIFDDVVYTKEFSDNPQKYIDILERNFRKSKHKKNYFYNRFGLYSTLSRHDIVNDPKYMDYLVKNISEIYEYEDIDGWIKDAAPKTLKQLHLKSSVYAPDFTFFTIGKEKHRLEDYRGKWVLLDFWGTWCGPCVMETPYLVDAYKKLGGENFEIISISSDRSAKVVDDYMEKNQMFWTNTIELDGYTTGVLELYGITAFPTVMLVNPEGKFVKVEEGELRGDLLIPTLVEKMGVN